MKKITAFIGSARKNATYRAVQEFERHLRQREEVEFEYVFLSEYRLEFCRGCKRCFDRGEDFCLLKDDREALVQKMLQSDGIVFAVPNYAFQVPARMKNFLDRTAYFFHRPAFFGKTFTAIVVQGVFGGRGILKYLGGIGTSYGFHVTRGACVNTLEPMTLEREEILVAQMKKAAARFYRGLKRAAPPAPSFFRLMLFRLTRTALRSVGVRLRDYDYFQEKGWFKSPYYYETGLGPLKAAAGAFFDLLGRMMASHA